MPSPADAYAITAARKAARSLDADCPNCGAITGAPCRAPGGHPMHRYHLVRTRNARELAQLRVCLRLESEALLKGTTG